jgi:hypothetical protein
MAGFCYNGDEYSSFVSFIMCTNLTSRRNFGLLIFSSAGLNRFPKRAGRTKKCWKTWIKMDLKIPGPRRRRVF